MSSKETILSNIQILFSNMFKTSGNAFAFFDSDRDNKLCKNEIANLFKNVEIGLVISGFLTRNFIESYDDSVYGLVDWKAFKAAIDDI